jgi:hypothetical protein
MKISLSRFPKVEKENGKIKNVRFAARGNFSLKPLLIHISKRSRKS